MCIVPNAYSYWEKCENIIICLHSFLNVLIYCLYELEYCLFSLILFWLMFIYNL